MAAQTGTIHVSKLEDTVADELARRGIQFYRQVPLRGPDGRYIGVLDFVVNGVALEVNGTFWHTDPRVYPNGPTYAVQRRNHSRYERKRMALKEQDILLVELWELDVRKSLSDAVGHVLTKIF